MDVPVEAVEGTTDGALLEATVSGVVALVRGASSLIASFVISALTTVGEGGDATGTRGCTRSLRGALES